MNNDKNQNSNSAQESSSGNNEEALPVHNPFKEGDFKQVTEQDVENEQKFKEAMTERD